MRLKITHYSTTSNGEQMAAWTAFAVPIFVATEALEDFRALVKETIGGTIYLRYEEVENNR